MGYEIIIEFSSGQIFVVFAKNIEQYREMLKTVQDENYRRACENREVHKMKDGRVMKRGPRGAMSVEDFKAACF